MKPEIKYILFDVAGTLLHKPTFYKTFHLVLTEAGINVSHQDIKLKHKILSEAIHFPDRTTKDFYRMFNSELLFSLGVLPKEKLLNEIFERCSYLPWEKFEDSSILNELSLPFGVISNFNFTLREKLNYFFGPVFHQVLVSEELGVAKPNIEFYQKAIEMINIPPENVLYIGDSLKLDIKPALETGLNPLLIDRDGFYSNSDYRIESLKEVLKYQ